MTYPPLPPDPNRPQDTPRTFPSYARPQDTPPPAPWTAPGGPVPPQRTASPYGVPPAASPYGAPTHPGAPPYGPAPTPYGPPGAPPYGYPAAYGYGYPGTTLQTTNGLAVAALITALAGIVISIAAPVAVGLGIAALVQIKRRGQAGTAQAVIGLVVGGLITVVWAVLMIAMIAVGFAADDEYTGSSSPTSSQGQPALTVDNLVVGECFDDGSVEEEVERAACTDPHDAELYAVVTLPAQPWPGDEKVGDQAEAACDREFRTYVGIPSDRSELEPVVWYPDLDAWSHGDRNAYCTTYGPDEDPLTGTVKNTKR